MSKENTPLEGIRIGYALCGSFCTFSRSIDQIIRLKEMGADITPIMSFNAASINTRFGTAESFRSRISEITGKDIIRTIEDAEPIGPRKMLDIVVVCPCTGNTLAKLAAGVTDTPVTMAVKSHIRNERPVVIAAATNDGLAASAHNIGQLLNRRGYYFVPFGQDDPSGKPRSLIADFNELSDTVLCALKGIQFQPLIL